MGLWSLVSVAGGRYRTTGPFNSESWRACDLWHDHSRIFKSVSYAICHQVIKSPHIHGVSTLWCAHTHKNPTASRMCVGHSMPHRHACPLRLAYEVYSRTRTNNTTYEYYYCCCCFVRVLVFKIRTRYQVVFYRTRKGEDWLVSSPSLPSNVVEKNILFANCSSS